MSGPIPVTLVTGFLGAGKTTLLEHILGAETGRRFAIIENEFGDVGVDGLLVSAPKDAVFELNDGCVCCTVREDLVEVFDQILARTDAFDHVIIETTGLAEPGPVMRLFERPAVRQALTLDGVVTVVDGAHLEQSLDDVTACAAQVAYADLLILNKVDGLSSQAIEAVEARLRRLNPLARILRAAHARVDVGAVLDLGGRPAEASVPAQLAEGADEHAHDDEIGAVVVEVPGNIDVDALDLWLGRLVRGRVPNVLRMKGILGVADDPRRFVFNGVRTVVDVRPDAPWGIKPRYSRVVLIGTGLDSAALQAGFASCMADTSLMGATA